MKKIVNGMFVGPGVTLFRMLLTSLVLLVVAAGAVSAKGKKYGLFVGINDYPVSNKLEGAVPDAQNLKTLLETKFGFLAANTTLLTDAKATRANILSKLREYGRLAGVGDLFVFQYSGHGTIWEDAYSDEMDETQKVEVDILLGYDRDGNEVRYKKPLDFYDSAICPVDEESTESGKIWGNLILDDELYTMFAAMTKKGANVVFISDSCHSGTVGKAVKNNGKFRFTPPERALGVKDLSELKLTAPKNQKKVDSRNLNGRYITLAAAKDDETAMDSPGGTVVGGLFTTKLIEVIKASKTPLTYKRLMELVQPRVAKISLDVFENNQHPQLDSRFGNINLKIFTIALKK